jgi:hypothetical protein
VLSADRRAIPPSVLRQPVPLILLAVSLVLRRGRSRRPSEFLSKPERSNLVETLRGLAALSLHGAALKPTLVLRKAYMGAALSLHV